MAAFPKCSFIEVWLGLANGQHAVISFALTGSQSLILMLSPAQATLDRDTVALSKGYDAVILFVNDDCSAEVGTVEAGRETACQLRFDKHQTADRRVWGIRHVQVAEALKENGVKFVAMRCAGFDKVDVKKLNELDIKVSACLHSCLCAQANRVKHHCIQLEHTWQALLPSGGTCADIFPRIGGGALCHTGACTQQVPLDHGHMHADRSAMSHNMMTTLFCLQEHCEGAQQGHAG